MKKLILFGLVLLMLISSAFAVIDDPIAGWTFDTADVSGGNPIDVCTATYDLTAGGSPSSVTGVINEQFQYVSTSSQYVQDTTFATVGSGNAFTLVYFVEFQNTGNGRYTHSIGGGATNNFLSRGYTFGGNLYVDVQKAGTVAFASVNTGAVSTSTQYHLAVVYYGNGTIQAYRNGASAGVATGTPVGTDNTNIILGAGRETTSSPTAYSDSKIDEAYFYDRALSASEISDLYNGGSGVQPCYTFPSDIATLNAADADNATTLLTFNATINDNATVFTTTNGTIYINVSASGFDETQLQNFTFYADTYFDKTYYDWNITSVLLANLTEWPHVSVNNTWDGTPLQNITVEYNSVNYTGNANYTYIPANETANVTIYKTGYIPKKIEHDFSSSNNLDTKLSQSNINFTISEVYSNNSILEFNFTLSNGTKYQTTNGTIPLEANSGNIDFIIDALPYLQQNVSYTISSLEEGQVNFPDFSTGILYLYLVQTQDPNTSIPIFTASVNGTWDYSTTTGNVTIPTIVGDDYYFDLSSSGYFDKTENLTINETYMNVTYNLSISGGVLFRFFDSETGSLVTGEIDLEVQNDTFQESYSFTGGTQIVTNLTEDESWTFYFNSSGYATNTYYLTYQNQSIIDLYLIPGTENITYQLSSQAGEVLQGVDVTVETFINGSYVEIASQLTDVTGLSIFALRKGVTHRITYSLEGYLSKVDISRLDTNYYSVILQQSEQFNFDLGHQYITTDVYPKNTTLYPKTWEFLANITSSVGNLEYVFGILRYNGSILALDNISSNVGGLINLTYDLSAYNNTLVSFEYGYLLSNYSEQTSSTTVYYIVDLQYYTGSLLELKDRLASSLTNAERIGLYAVVFFVVLIFVSIFVQGLPAIVVALALATLAGWIFGINILILVFVTVVIVTFAIAYGEGIQ